MLQRIVIKQEYMTYEIYRDNAYYYLLNGMRTPREAYCHKVLQRPAGAIPWESITRLISHAHRPQLPGWRFFLEYCPYRTLEDLVSTYRALR